MNDLCILCQSNYVWSEIIPFMVLESNDIKILYFSSLSLPPIHTYFLIKINKQVIYLYVYFSKLNDQLYFKHYYLLFYQIL